MEEPSYSKIAMVYGSNGVWCRHIPMDKSGISVEDLRESGADVVHVSPSHHYPTGIVMPVSRRCELLSWAAEESGRYIIEDDYDWEFRLSGKPFPPLAGIDAGEKVIYMNTFTKSLASTVRISYMVLPPHLAKLYVRKLGFYACTVSNFEQYTLARFIHDGYFEKHINRMRNFYKNQRNMILAEIQNSRLAGIVKIMEADAGLHFLMAVDTKMSDEEIAGEAEKRGVRISFMTEYYSGMTDKVTLMPHVMVINYSGIAPEAIPRAVECLAEILVSQ